MATTSKSMRLNSKETELIQFLRDTSMQTVINELKSTYDLSPNMILKQIINILDDNDSAQIDLLVKSGYLTREQADYLIDCINANKNIIIIGPSDSKKTNLARALIKEINKDVKVLIAESSREQIGTDSPTATLNEIASGIKTDSPNLLKTPPKRVVIGNIRTLDDAAALITALYHKVGILAIMNGPLKNWQSSILQLLDVTTKDLAQKVLSKNIFTIIETSNSLDSKVVAINQEKG